MKPGGMVRIADLSSEGEAEKPSNWGAFNSMLRPEGASVSFVVALAWITGLKVSRSHSVIAG